MFNPYWSTYVNTPRAWQQRIQIWLCLLLFNLLHLLTRMFTQMVSFWRLNPLLKPSKKKIPGENPRGKNHPTSFWWKSSKHPPKSDEHFQASDSSDHPPLPCGGRNTWPKRAPVSSPKWVVAPKAAPPSRPARRRTFAAKNRDSTNKHVDFIWLNHENIWLVVTGTMEFWMTFQLGIS